MAEVQDFGGTLCDSQRWVTQLMHGHVVVEHEYVRGASMAWSGNILVANIAWRHDAWYLYEHAIVEHEYVRGATWKHEIERKRVGCKHSSSEAWCMISKQMWRLSVRPCDGKSVLYVKSLYGIFVVRRCVSRVGDGTRWLDRLSLEGRLMVLGLGKDCWVYIPSHTSDK